MKHKALIIGAGFAGLKAAICLRERNFDVTVVDKRAYHFYVPGIFGYTIGKLSKKDVTLHLPLLLSQEGITFLKGEVRAIDLKNKLVKIHKKSIPFDYLVLAIGSDTATYNTPGVAHAYFFKTLEDAEKLKRALRSAVKSIAIVGGGITGCELAAYLKNLKPGTQITILDAAGRVVKELPLSVSRTVARHLKQSGVEMRFKRFVKHITDKTLHFKSGENMHADLIIWVAGVSPPAELQAFGLKIKRGILVNPYLQCVEHEHVFGIGDCITFADEAIEKSWIRRAQSAHKQGGLAAENIWRHKNKVDLRPFKYQEMPTLVELDQTAILHFKKYQFNSRLVTALYELIRLRHMLYYRSFLRPFVDMVY